jgi:PAS domain S-box-containing protein
MKTLIFNKIRILLAFGLIKNQPVFEARQIKTLNYISFVLVVINLFLIVFNLIAQRYIPLFLNIALVFGVSLPIFLLNAKYKYEAAQIYSFFASNTLILLYSCFGVINNRIVNFEILILGCGFFGAFIFNHYWMTLSIIFNLASYLIIAFMKIEYINAIPDSVFLGSLINCFATTAFLYAIIGVYKKDFKKTEQALSQSEDRLKLVLKGTNTGWWDWDWVSNKLYYSPLWWSMLGYEVNELEPDPTLWQRIMHPEERERIDREVQDIFNSNIVSYEIKFRLRHKNGSYIPVLSKGYIKRAQDGSILRVSGSNMDLSEQKLTEERLQSLVINISETNKELFRQNEEIQIQSAELEALNQSKDKLFSIIAHDIRSPVTSLVSTLNSIKDEALTIQDLQDCLPDLTKNTNDILELIDSLLGWARTQLGGAKVYPRIFPLNRVIESEIDFFTARAKEKKISLSKSDFGEINVFADKDMISLVLRNLISNAVKFCKANDSIEIRVSRLNDKAEVEVSDTGKGISKEMLSKLFSNGVVSTGGTSGEIGTGLGLMLSKEFVQKNSGTFRVQSEFGKGSQFFFTIPISE